MRASLVLMALALGVAGGAAGCSRQSPEKPTAPSTDAAGDAAGDAAASSAPSPAAGSAQGHSAALDLRGGEPRDVKVENREIDFEYGYPAQADAIPELKAWLEADMAKRKGELVANAREQAAADKREGLTYNALGNWITWKVVTDLPGWLSLSADVSDYQGGAHPNHGFDALLWDRQARARRAPIDLFASKAALSRAIRKPFCARLNELRAQKRGSPVDPRSTDEFDQCIDPAASTLILGSSNHAAFDRIGVLVAPYDAGPYAEGDYEVTLPVTPAVIAAVRPAYRGLFAAGR